MLRLGALVLLLGIASPGAATACEPASTGWSEIAPADGAVDVSTRTWVLISASDEVAELAPPHLAGDDGSVIPLYLITSWPVSGGHVVLQFFPGGLLTPTTRYQVMWRLPRGCAPSTCLGASPVAVASFITGASTDDVPPSFAGVTGVVLGERREVDDACGPYRVVNVAFTHDGASDDRGPARFIVERVNPAGHTIQVTGPIASVDQGVFLCHDSLPGENGPAADFVLRVAGTYRLRALDGSGNRDDNMATVLIDGHVCVDAPPTLDPEPDGCRAHPGGVAGAPLVLGALLLLVRRRRRVA
jgi:hypothetical protein